MTALLIAVVVCIASFIHAPDLDAPKVYYKACIYCQDCTPVCELMEVDSLRGLCCDYFGEVYLLSDTAYYENGFGGHCDIYRCQRTGKRMVFDSVGVVQWGTVLEISTHPKWGDAAMWDVIVADTTVIADTSGIMRIQ